MKHCGKSRKLDEKPPERRNLAHAQLRRVRGESLNSLMDKNDQKSDSPLDEADLVVTHEDYEAGLKRGWTDDDMLKPGRYKFKHGGFLARREELKIKEKKRA
jgi:hypothetical protein